jgi:hypothetical protein
MTDEKICNTCAWSGGAGEPGKVRCINGKLHESNDSCPQWDYRYTRPHPVPMAELIKRERLTGASALEIVNRIMMCDIMKSKTDGSCHNDKKLCDECRHFTGGMEGVITGEEDLEAMRRLEEDAMREAEKIRKRMIKGKKE